MTCCGFGGYGGFGGGFGPSLLGYALGFNYAGCAYPPYYYGGPTYNRHRSLDVPYYGDHW